LGAEERSDGVPMGPSAGIHSRRELPDEAKRELSALTSAVEKKVLLWLAARLPRGVNPDHLTGLALLAMVGAGAAYWAARQQPLWVHAVNVCLFLNWFGDSLDGSLARYRQKLRPKYGFYVDHMCDAFGALFLLVGLGHSGLMTERVALVLLVVYFLMTINIGYATYARGTFKISYGLVGGTELRILLAIANLAVLYRPTIVLGGTPRLLFDVIGVAAIVALAVIVVRSTLQNTIHLYQKERVDW
jgi:archaetidylinositol phosphate synthase